MLQHGLDRKQLTVKLSRSARYNLRFLGNRLIKKRSPYRHLGAKATTKPYAPTRYNTFLPATFWLFGNSFEQGCNFL